MIERCRHDHASHYSTCQDARAQPGIGATFDKANRIPTHAAEGLRSSGQPIDKGTRDIVERRFGFDFAEVRVHTDARAARSARAINARAYTVGRDVIFAPGGYAPRSNVGLRLLAHELAHVIQQSRGGAETPIQSLEEDAETAATQFTAAAPIKVRGFSPLRIALAPAPESSAAHLRHHGLTPSEIGLLNEVRIRLVPNGERSTAIVGVLIADDGRRFELRSGGGQGFSAHVEGKATAKMEELGITRATLLVEKEPCQICDRSVYSQQAGPETPLESSRTGRDLSRQTPKINTALTLGSELTVVDPHSASLYRGVKSVPATGVRPILGTEHTQAPKGDRQQPSPPHLPEPSARTDTTDRSSTPPTRRVAADVGTPGSRTAAGGVTTASAEIADEARAGAAELSADLRLLRAAQGLRAAVELVGAIGTVLMLDSFTKMTMSALRGKGFILTQEIAEADGLATKSSALKRDYAPFSEQLGAQWLTLGRAAGDPHAAGQAAADLMDLAALLRELERDLSAQLSRIDAAFKEATAKQKAAEAILSDPQASATIAAVTFGTAELALLFAASQDLSRIAGALGRTSASLTTVRDRIAEDAQFAAGWFESLFEVCRKGGHCARFALEIPFVGTSTIHVLP